MSASASSTSCSASTTSCSCCACCCWCASVRQLLATITAFTLAHSITLAAATLGFIHVPAAPVEATIALSIVFLASELVRGEAGRGVVTRSYPWLVAFSFGLLHGLGFAGALAEVGLPQGEIPLALFAFNVGCGTWDNSPSSPPC